MKNKLVHLNDHLFAQIERISDEGLTEEEFVQEIKRSAAIVALSDQILGSSRLRLAGAKLVADYGHELKPMVSNLIEGKQ